MPDIVVRRDNSLVWNSTDFAVSHIVGLTKRCKPKKDRLQIAKEILEINPDQRIIFTSAFVKEH